jgi:homoserine dehydrogenase
MEGWDAAAKAAALANVLMGADITPHDVDRCGIGLGTAARARAVRSAGRRLRLVAAARRSGGRVVATVQPTELAADDLLASLRGPANALVLETDLLGEVAVHQLGGDLTMTAYALLSDVITIRRRTR